MTPQTAIRWTTTALQLGMALLAGTVAAQQAPVADKAQEQTPAAKAEPEAAAASKTQPEASSVQFQSWKDKLSYAIGADLVRGLKGQGIDVNTELLIKAVRDASAGNTLVMTDADVTATLKRFEDERKHDYEHAKGMLAAKNKKAGEAFFAANLKKAGVVTLPSGLQYKILNAGDGKKPKGDDTLECHYRGTLLDGTEFDNSYKRNQPATFALNRTIKGWSEALQLMPVGSKWQVFIPPQLAYGDRGAAGVIGPNATLIFEVELISIKDTSSAAARAPQKQDATNSDVGTKQEVASDSAIAAPAAPSEIKIAFKDPRPSDPPDGGERWSSTPTFSSAAQGGTEATVEAKAVGVDANGTQGDATAEWTPADPEMVTVVPGFKNQVRITVHRAGESKLTVASNGVSKELLIKAESVGNNAIQVEIAQKQ
jgi:FKBP-type peptidyl-prolyl cis-trans isomerase FklB